MFGVQPGEQQVRRGRARKHTRQRNLHPCEREEHLGEELDLPDVREVDAVNGHGLAHLTSPGSHVRRCRRVDERAVPWLEVIVKDRPERQTDAIGPCRLEHEILPRAQGSRIDTEAVPSYGERGHAAASITTDSLQLPVARPSVMSLPAATLPSAPAAAGPPAGQRLIVLIPAYNEAGKIGAVIEDIRTEMPSADILVVNDGSSDATATEAREAGADVLSLPVNLGYGAALQTGYKYAVRGGYDIIGQIDGDGQHLARFLNQMVDRLRDPDVDVVVGSRFLDGDGHYQPSLARKMGMALFSGIASAVMRQHISDPTSGFQVMRRPVASFFCSEVYPADYPDADILILLHRSGFRVTEMAVQMREPDGKSMHAGHRSLYYMYKMTLSITMTMLRRASGEADRRGS